MTSRPHAADDFTVIRQRMKELHPDPPSPAETGDADLAVFFARAGDPKFNGRDDKEAWRAFSQKIGCRRASTCHYDLSHRCVTAKKCLA